jgi:cysteine sulfinate desulfinase/cysteine desulfurase-like protein
VLKTIERGGSESVDEGERELKAGGLRLASIDAFQRCLRIRKAAFGREHVKTQSVMKELRDLNEE